MDALGNCIWAVWDQVDSIPAPASHLPPTQTLHQPCSVASPKVAETWGGLVVRYLIGVFEAQSLTPTFVCLLGYCGKSRLQQVWYMMSLVCPSLV